MLFFFLTKIPFPVISVCSQNDSIQRGNGLHCTSVHSSIMANSRNNQRFNVNAGGMVYIPLDVNQLERINATKFHRNVKIHESIKTCVSKPAPIILTSTPTATITTTTTSTHNISNYTTSQSIRTDSSRLTSPTHTTTVEPSTHPTRLTVSNLPPTVMPPLVPCTSNKHPCDPSKTTSKSNDPPEGQGEADAAKSDELLLETAEKVKKN